MADETPPTSAPKKPARSSRPKTAASSAKGTSLDLESKITYLHRRIARLERNNGQFVHPHPNQTTVEEQRETELKASQERKLQEANKRRIAEESARETLRRKANDEADLTGPIEIAPGGGE